MTADRAVVRLEAIAERLAEKAIADPFRGAPRFNMPLWGCARFRGNVPPPGVRRRLRPIDEHEDAPRFRMHIFIDGACAGDTRPPRSKSLAGLDEFALEDEDELRPLVPMNRKPGPRARI